MQELSAQQLADWLNDGSRPAPLLLDVREPWEFETCHIDGARLLPMGTISPQVTQELAQSEPSAPIVCICHHGGRSLQVAAFLEQQGLEGIHNLSGGMHAWALQVDPAMPTY